MASGTRRVLPCDRSQPHLRLPRSGTGSSPPRGRCATDGRDRRSKTCQNRQQGTATTDHGSPRSDLHGRRRDRTSRARSVPQSQDALASPFWRHGIETAPRPAPPGQRSSRDSSSSPMRVGRGARTTLVGSRRCREPEDARRRDQHREVRRPTGRPRRRDAVERTSSRPALVGPRRPRSAKRRLRQPRSS